MAKKDGKTVLYVQGANGIYHSVPENRLQEFGAQQEKLEKDAGRKARLDRLNERAAALLKK